MDKFFQDDLSLFAVPLYLLAVLLEAVWSYRKGLGLYRGQDTLASLSMMLTAAGVEIAPRILALAVMIKLYELSPFTGFLVNQWWVWLALFLLDDFTFYWFHRTNHQIRILWAGHVNHHSSQYFNFGTALRQGVGERLHKYVFWMWLPLLGFHPSMLITMISISLFYQFWIHTRTVRRLPALFEAVFNTPSHHRVHHASNIRYLDCNHGGILIIWDKLFGTFSPELDHEPVVYGLTTNINSDNPLVVLSHEYCAIWRDIVRANRWPDRLAYLLRAPGWSHDGSDKRARTLRREAKVA
jgi:sterol desaturase/sphingolipid hydroxylase (fatty acid hydroxylase superfamily)